MTVTVPHPQVLVTVVLSSSDLLWSRLSFFLFREQPRISRSPLKEHWLVCLGYPLNIPCVKDIAGDITSAAMITGPCLATVARATVYGFPLKQRS